MFDILYSAGRFRSALLLGVLSVTPACAFESGSLEEKDSSVAQEAIYGGNLYTQEVGSPDPAVIKFAKEDGETLCSGIKLAARRFLTAAHCHFENLTSTTITNALDGSGGTTVNIVAAPAHPTSWAVPSDSLYQDFQIVDVDRDTPMPSYPMFRPGYVPTNSSAALIAYGRDLKPTNPNNSWKRQYAFFTTGATNNSGFDDTWFFLNGSDPRPDSGDSGGPVFITRLGQKEVAGVISAGGLTARVSGSFAWLNDPRINLFQHDRKGFFLQKASNKPLSLSSQSSSSQVRIRVWDGRDHWTGVDSQYWRLESASVGGTFRIVNTKTGRCLKAHTDDNVVQATCSTATDQRWSFDGTTGGYSRIRNVGRNMCMTTTSDAIDTRVSVATCSSSSRQRWLFSN
jgi:hypothetical protein